MIFDVAVWLSWSCDGGSASLPEIALGDAPNAFAAVAGVMRLHGVRAAGHVAARALDGSIVYRAYGLVLAQDESGDGSGGRCAVGGQASLGA